MVLAKDIAPLGAMPRIDKATRRSVFNRAAYRDFDIAHPPPRRVRTSDQKSTINCQ
jgi:hypothetical protein